MKDLIKKISGDKETYEILSKGFSFLSIRVLGLFAGYLFAYLVSRHYGAGVYGLVSLSFSLFLLAGILGRLGTDINLVRYYALDDNWSDKGMFFRVLLKSVMAAVLFAGILYYSKDFFVNVVFKKPELEPYFLWIALAIPPWVVVLLCGGLLRARRMNSWFAFLNNPGRFIFTIAVLLVLLGSSSSALNAIIAHFYGILLLSVVAIIKAVSVLKKITFRTSRSSWNFLKASYPMMLSSTILLLLGWMDTFVLGIYETDSNIGIYNVALKVAALTSFTLQAINSILAPKLARTFGSGEKEVFARLIRFGTRINFFITLVIVAVLIAFRSTILGIFGEEFLVGGLILVILCIGQLVNSLSGSVGIILQMTGHQKVYQNIVLIALFLNLVLNFSLTPVYGGLGAALATVFSIASWNIMGAVYLKKRLKITSYYDFK